MSTFEYPLQYQQLPYSILTFTDRLYLASYSEPPTEHTLFPYPDPEPRSPRKRSQRTIDQVTERKKPYYFTVDDTLLYNAFHHDFGPFHIGHLYRFALQFHEILGAKENKDRPVVFWSRADPRSRSSKSASSRTAKIADQCYLRSCQCLLSTSLLHGFDPIVASASSSCAGRPG